MNKEYFNYAVGLTMTNKNLILFGGPPRKPESELTQEMDIARSVQEVIEEIVLKIGEACKKATRKKYLCLLVESR